MDIRKRVKEVEESKMSIFYFIFAFLSAVTLRTFIETYSDTPVGNLSEYTAANLIHYYLWYTGLAMVISIILYLATGERIKKILRLVLPAFIVLLIAPLVDIILSGGKGFDMSYLLPGVHDPLLIWLTFSGYFSRKGATPGISIEAILALAGCFAYVAYIKRKGIIRGLIATFAVYSAIFWWGCIPFGVRHLLEGFGITYSGFSSVLGINFILLCLIPIGCITAYLYDRNYFVKIAKGISPFAVLHYEMMFFLGIAIAYNIFGTGPKLDEQNFFKWLFIPFIILLAGAFSCHAKRLSEVKFTQEEKVIGKSLFLLFLLIMIYSLAIDHITCFIFLLLVCNSFMYWMPPFSLRERIPILSKVLISVSSFSIILLGYYHVTGFTHLFPAEVLLFFAVGYPVALNFIDLREYEIDKKKGIPTLPVILGLKKGKVIIGLSFILLYTIASLYLKNNFLIPLFVTIGFLQFMLVNQKRDLEKIVFIVYLLSLLMFIIFMLT